MCDLTLVHLGVKFSCKFTLSEIQERWYALLYDPAVSRIATQAMRGLHPEQVGRVTSAVAASLPPPPKQGFVTSAVDVSLPHPRPRP